MLMTIHTEEDLLLREADDFLPLLDQVFLSSALSTKEAAERVKNGEKILRRLKGVENPGARVNSRKELYEVAINLAKEEVGNEEKSR